MKNRLTLYGGIFLVTLFLTTPAAFAQDGNIKASSSGNAVIINSDGVEARSADGSKVRTGTPKVQSKTVGKTLTRTLQYTDDTTISGKTIVTDGDGVILKGDGDYILENCSITSGRNAVVVADNATVTMKNCVIAGVNSAILINGNGTLKASSNTISGTIRKKDNADFKDIGGNVFK